MKYKHIALITDFGSDDNFVGVMKGVIYTINPKVNIIDITHNIPAHDIKVASFLLVHSYKYFPPKTLFLCVVDPEVGTSRKVIIIKINKKIFVAPDNGLLSYIFEREKKVKIYEVKIPNKYISNPVSNTFHGRDIFAPLAGFISRGVKIEEMARQINKIQRIEPFSLKKTDKKLQGEIIYIDRFGNCISNISKEDFDNFTKNKKFFIKIKNYKIRNISEHYKIKEKFGVLFNSFNLLEFFVPQNNFSKMFKVKTKTPVAIKIT